MSDRERAIDIINQIPEYKMIYVIEILNGLKGVMGDTINEETADAINEVSVMQKDNSGQHFDGSTKEFFEMMMSD